MSNNMKKYTLTKTTKEWCGQTLFQIKAEMDFGNVSKGELGGYIEKEDNLSQDGNAWVSGNADWCLFSSFGSSNRTTTVHKTKTSIQVNCGCFSGTILEFEKQVKETHKGNEFEKEYLAIIEVIKAKFKL